MSYRTTFYNSSCEKGNYSCTREVRLKRLTENTARLLFGTISCHPLMNAINGVDSLNDEKVFVVGGKIWK